MAKKQEIQKNSDTTAESYFKHLTVTFNSYTRIKQPDMTDEYKFYKVYSPLKFKLRPREDIKIQSKNIERIRAVDEYITFFKRIWFKCRKSRHYKKQYDSIAFT